MAVILYEDFETGVDGTALTGTNTAFDTVTGTGTCPFEVDTALYVAGTRSGRLYPSASGTRYLKYNGSAGDKTTYWVTFYMYVTTLPTVSANVFIVYGNTLLAAECRLSSAGVLSVRDYAFISRVTGPTLSAGQWYRIAVRLTPGDGLTGMQMKTYSGADLHTSTPTTNTTSSAATWQVSVLDELNFGICSGTAEWEVNYDEFRIDDADEWMPPSSGSPVTYIKRVIIGA